MDPAHGAQLWKQYIEPLKNEGYTILGSPATSSNPNGKVWVQNWLDACNGGCNVSITVQYCVPSDQLMSPIKPTHMVLHYYSTTASGFIDYMKLWHNTFNKPIMVTEFACQVC
jgi:hypothetical protein